MKLMPQYAHTYCILPLLLMKKVLFYYLNRPIRVSALRRFCLDETISDAGQIDNQISKKNLLHLRLIHLSVPLKAHSQV